MECEDIKNFFISKIKEKHLINYISSYYRWSDIINKYDNDWTKISKHKYLHPDFIEEYKDKLDWYYISAFQRLSETEIEKYKHYVLWDIVILKSYISMKFIKKHAHRTKLSKYITDLI